MVFVTQQQKTNKSPTINHRQSAKNYQKYEKSLRKKDGAKPTKNKQQLGEKGL